ncbi:MAG TPA: DUF4019 domain-containing protein [Pyrinomonadaceae bacterium]|nr:DUF4019 domain-containing protein [Pyrinomonadaceae bacterium]
MRHAPSRSVYCVGFGAVSFLGLTLTLAACGSSNRRSGIPPGAQAVLDAAFQDIDEGNYDKLYQEAADEWRNQVSLEDSRTKMQQLRDSMGKVRTRTLQTAREEQTSTAPVAGHSLTAFYQTAFEKGPGMEAFVLIEHGGRWYLAKYYVTSSGLK